MVNTLESSQHIYHIHGNNQVISLKPYSTIFIEYNTHFVETSLSIALLPSALAIKTIK